MTLSRPHCTLSALILLALASVRMLGCSAAERFELPDAPPSDFVLAATVFTPAATDKDQPASVPARYIVEPDGTLRAAIGAGSSPTTYPRATRTLTSAQFDQLWTLTRAIDLDGDGARAINSPEIFTPPGDTGVVLIELRADETQQGFAFPADHPQTRALIEALADLAWVRTD